MTDFGGDKIEIDQTLTQNVIQNKDKIFAEVEKKGENKSLRGMFNYIEYMSSM